MINNYLKIALRSLIRNKSFTLINVIGLIIGIASCILIYLLISFEQSYDNFHRDKDRIYRVVSEIKNNDGVRYTPGVPFPVAGVLRIDFPDLEKAADILLAAPISYLIMQNWLEDFAFRIDINIWIFLLAAAGSLVFAWITVDYHSIKAATANPVESLRYE